MFIRSRTVAQSAAVLPFDWRVVVPVDGSRQVVTSPSVLPAAIGPPDECTPEAVLEPPDRETRLAALERDAFATGFAQGERAGAEAAGERGQAMLRRLTETLEELTTVRAQMIQQTERQMVQLALAVARRIVQREVSLDNDLLIAMARVALERLGESAQVTVRLHPEEFEATAAARAAGWTGTSVQVIADARVGRGGCRIDSEFGMVDAGVDAQIQELARALLGDGEGMNAATR